MEVSLVPRAESLQVFFREQHRGGLVDTSGMPTRRARARGAKGWKIWALAIAGGILWGGAPRAAESRPWALHFVDVGQGAALVAVGHESAVVIDSGPSGSAEALLKGLEGHGIKRVDLWIHTHFDADHLGGIVRAEAGMDGVVGTEDDLEVIELWDRGIDAAPSTAVMGAYLDSFGDRRRRPEVGERWDSGGLMVEVVHRGSEEVENGRGIALRLDVGSASVLVLGDLPAAEGVLAAERGGPVDVLWASHHGAANGFDPALIDHADPSAVVISAGFRNSYCHPAPEVLSWLQARTVWVTGAAGIGADGRCPGLAGSLGGDHRVLGGELVLAVDP